VSCCSRDGLSGRKLLHIVIFPAGQEGLTLSLAETLVYQTQQPVKNFRSFQDVVFATSLPMMISWASKWLYHSKRADSRAGGNR
jgi:hypothetical protein